MSKAGILRLQKEYKALLKEPAEFIDARPSESDIFKWHYVIRGPADSPYADGVYHGLLQFPRDYPYKAPRITMRTPNGRFAVDTRLCLSISDFHPETWNPLWRVSSILAGLLSFLLEEEITTGSIVTSPELKRRYARESLAFNLQDPVFCRLFPQYLEQQQPAPSVSVKQEPRDDPAEQDGHTNKLKKRGSKVVATALPKKQVSGAPASQDISPRSKQQQVPQRPHSWITRTFSNDGNVDRLIILVMIVLLGLLLKQLY